jgi:sigma-B regulation protein RsbU (phosphoserine phosphatase)
MKLKPNKLALKLKDYYQRKIENVGNFLTGKAADLAQAAIDRKEMQQAMKMQKAFLPNSIPKCQGWEIEHCLLPAREVTGDFYDVFYLSKKEDHLCLIIGDVCNKGVEAALFMVLFISALRFFAGLKGQRLSNLELEEDNETVSLGDKDLRNILNAVAQTNHLISSQYSISSSNMYATLFFGVLNTKNGILTYINAAHPSLFILGPTGIKYELESTGMAVGNQIKAKFMTKQVKLETGDILFGYTDGVTDTENANKEKIGKGQLRSLLEKEPITSARELLERLNFAISDFAGNHPQFDDITMLIVRRE